MYRTKYTCCTNAGPLRAFVESADLVVRQFIDGWADGLSIW